MCLRDYQQPFAADTAPCVPPHTLISAERVDVEADAGDRLVVHNGHGKTRLGTDSGGGGKRPNAIEEIAEEGLVDLHEHFDVGKHAGHLTGNQHPIGFGSCHAFEWPHVPTRPSLHSSFAAHSMVS